MEESSATASITHNFSRKCILLLFSHNLEVITPSACDVINDRPILLNQETVVVG